MFNLHAAWENHVLDAIGFTVCFDAVVNSIIKAQLYSPTCGVVSESKQKTTDECRPKPYHLNIIQTDAESF